MKAPSTVREITSSMPADPKICLCQIALTFHLVTLKRLWSARPNHKLKGRRHPNSIKKSTSTRHAQSKAAISPWQGERRGNTKNLQTKKRLSSSTSRWTLRDSKWEVGEEAITYRETKSRGLEATALLTTVPAREEVVEVIGVNVVVVAIVAVVIVDVAIEAEAIVVAVVKEEVAVSVAIVAEDVVGEMIWKNIKRTPGELFVNAELVKRKSLSSMTLPA